MSQNMLQRGEGWLLSQNMLQRGATISALVHQFMYKLLMAPLSDSRCQSAGRGRETGDAATARGPAWPQAHPSGARLLSKPHDGLSRGAGCLHLQVTSWAVS